MTPTQEVDLFQKDCVPYSLYLDRNPPSDKMWELALFINNFRWAYPAIDAQNSCVYIVMWAGNWCHAQCHKLLITQKSLNMGAELVWNNHLNGDMSELEKMIFAQIATEEQIPLTNPEDVIFGTVRFQNSLEENNGL